MIKFDEYLSSKGVNERLLTVFRDLFDAFKNISESMNVDYKGTVGGKNIFGEEQIPLDIIADGIVHDCMKNNEHVGLIASEERDEEIKIGNGYYAVCHDPLDGSSLVDVNLSVGTIVGIYEKKTFVGATGDDQVASMVAVYGPNTTVLLTVRQGVVKFVLSDEGEFVFSGDGYSVGEGKMFAPGNLRASKFRQDYLDLVNFWIKEQYTLRYSGGMVPDVVQIILKGKGIFSYPGYEAAPDGKLRLLFECAPMALLMEQAGGAASDGEIRILEKKITGIDQRTPIFIGSKEEVKRCEEYL